MKVNWLRLVGILLLCFSAAVIILSLAACAPVDDRTPGQIWISEHPTHAGPNGECIEFDNEPCDADPFDLDDLLEGPDRVKVSKKPSPKTVKPSSRPSPKRTR